MVTIKDAKETVNSIVTTLYPVSIVLFGSVAREGVGADLDLLVVTDDSSKINDSADMLLHKALKKFYKRFAVDPFIIPLSSLRRSYREGSRFLRLIAREGKGLYMRNAIGEWVKQSKDELNMASYLLKGGYFKGACYYAQQSIEKSMKSRLFRKGWDLEKTHSIERLIAIGRDYKIKFNLSSEEVVFMDSIYRGRYPLEAGLLPLGEPSEEEAKRAVGMAKRIFKTAEIKR